MVATRESRTEPSSSPRPRAARAVVVGVDSTPTSHAAVEWAAAEAVARKAPLHIVHSWVWPHLAPWLTSADREMHDDLARAGETLISSYRIAARDAGATEITSEVREGAPREVLSALSKQAQLLVVGSRHLGGLARTVLGSTSRAVAGESSCPTIVVTGYSGAPRRAGRLIVGISTAPSDEPVLQFAFDYAQDHGLPIHALFCWDTDDTPLPRLPIPQSTRAWLGESIAGWRGRLPGRPGAGLGAGCAARRRLARRRGRRRDDRRRPAGAPAAAARITPGRRRPRGRASRRVRGRDRPELVPARR